MQTRSKSIYLWISKSVSLLNIHFSCVSYFYFLFVLLLFRCMYFYAVIESFLPHHLVCACHFSHVQLFAILWTVASQAPLSMRFPKQEYWSGLPFSSPAGLPNPGIEPESLTSLEGSLLRKSLHWKAGSLPLGPHGKLAPNFTFFWRKRKGRSPRISECIEYTFNKQKNKVVKSSYELIQCICLIM